MSIRPLRWEKDPDEVLDFPIDWATNVLDEGDELDSSIWVVPAGITKDSDSNTTGTTTIWLSGGTLKQKYTIVNRVTTTRGRTYDQSATLTIKSH